jgi:hypothetical protein
LSYDYLVFDMQHYTLDQFRALSESGGVIGVTLRGNGGSFYIEAETRRGEAVLVPQRSKSPRRFPDPRKALALLRELGICEAKIDARDWRPEQLDLEKASRPDRKEQMKGVNEALEHDRWFREQVEIGLKDMREGRTIPNEEVKRRWADKRAELLKQAGANAAS